MLALCLTLGSTYYACVMSDAREYLYACVMSDAREYLLCLCYV